ncbi:hypothetical protein SBF1_4040004 [Candidatus Desulfosporosinus infrequens]|uniref:Uncharacterized protein n=1 Tax=Candidatus Desulfosporosinus infrequens TaxID=2043169 RepID=A0A2U3L8U2_9FIRM|nr:hypothetical protein SBF1_4040004 [Candidatus Desulfosporosinus infrequens]
MYFIYLNYTIYGIISNKYNFTLQREVAKLAVSELCANLLILVGDCREL